MKKYEVSAQVNSFIWTIVEAENQEEAEAKARAIHFEYWKLDTDYSTAEDFEVREEE